MQAASGERPATAKETLNPRRVDQTQRQEVTLVLPLYIRGGTRRELWAAALRAAWSIRKTSLHWPRFASSTLQFTSSRDLLVATGLVSRSRCDRNRKGS